MTARFVPALVAAISLSACMFDHTTHAGDPHATLPPAAPMLPMASSAGMPQPSELQDLNPAADVVEVNVTAAPAQVEYLPGKQTNVWAYNGSVPGPTLRARVGDQVIVHFKNQLPEATSIHWHGVRVPNDMDGAMTTVPAGGQFDYKFQVLDAGTYWFHPHANTAIQVEKGMYAAIVIDDPQPPALAHVADEVLVLDDVLLSPDSGALVLTAGERAQMMGREGNLLLVNGQAAPRTLAVRAGERRLWRLVNSANARYFQVELAGGTMVRVGGDRGWLAAPEPVQSLLLVPGQRAEVLVSASGGKPAVLRAMPYERAQGAGATVAAELVRLEPDNQPEVTPAVLPQTLAPFVGPGAAIATRKLVLDEKMAAMAAMPGMDVGNMMQFTINGQAFPNVPLLSAQTATTQAWLVQNDSTMDHPFHLHGFFFQPVGRSEWQDTVNVPAKQKMELLVQFDDRLGAAGMWMYHCHILEHAEGGMIGMVQIGGAK